MSKKHAVNYFKLFYSIISIAYFYFDKKLLSQISLCVIE